MRKGFYLPKGYDPQKGQGTIDDLNDLLNDIGVSFNVSKNNNGQILNIFIDEKRLKMVTDNKAGRPVKYDFDIEKIKQMKKDGKTNKQIYEELGMSKALFYLRLKECKNKIEQ